MVSVSPDVDREGAAVIAVGVLFVLLLIGLRAPLGAALARAASYSLTMLDRFHHERDAHPDRTAESLLTDVVGTTGRRCSMRGAR